MSLSVKKAVVLLSGGLDSATVMAIARHEGYQCYALSFAYGQRHNAELQAARRIAAALQAVQHKILPLSLDEIGGSALTDTTIPVPVTAGTGIPSTYVPARNTIFLSLALGWAEVLTCSDIFIGVNAVDYSGYPDCRPEYIQAYEKMASLATKAAVEGTPMRIHAPLLHLSKADIIRRGSVLGLNYAETVSCYQADAEGRACGHCDACRLRAQGFQQAGIPDLTSYVT